MPRLPLLLTFFKPEASTTLPMRFAQPPGFPRRSALVAVRSDQRTEPPYFFKRKKGFPMARPAALTWAFPCGG